MAVAGVILAGGRSSRMGAPKALLDYRGARRIFNIGGGAGRNLNEILAAIERVLGRAVERRYLPGRTFDVPANVLDIGLARSELDWRPATAFEDGLARTLRSFGPR